MNDFLDYQSILLWLAFLIQTFAFGTTGVLIKIREKKPPIRVRSPKMVLISHWANLTENLIVIYVLIQYKHYSSTSHWSYSLCTMAHFISHFLFFLPFILRSYRLYLIFSIEKNWDWQDIKFKKNLKKTREKHLLKLLALISAPFIAVYLIIYNLNSPLNFFEINGPSAYQEIVNCIALLILFIEQMCCIFAVNSLHRVDDDFNMTKELILVNIMWVLTSPNLIFNSYSYYSYQILLRNNCVYLISSVYPLYKSYKEEVFVIPLTEEALESLACVLSNKCTLQAFENFLKRTEISFQGRNGIFYLETWEKCVNLQSQGLLKINLSNDSLSSPEQFNETMQESVFSVLNRYFYPLFKHSQEFSSCLKRINLQYLYTTRLQQASLLHQ